MEADIRKLTALEAIRCRPAMYVRPEVSGSVPDQLLRAAMCHPLAELSCGTASGLSVSIDGLTASVSDDGAGWPVHPLPDGRRYAERLLCDLYACRDIKLHEELAHSLCLISLPVVVALSVEFTLDIHREGEHWQQTYRGGTAAGPLSVAGVAAGSGTTLTFTLDPEFCGEAPFSASAFLEWLATLEAVPVNVIPGTPAEEFPHRFMLSLKR
jgi:DNA gyrase subunit B